LDKNVDLENIDILNALQSVLSLSPSLDHNSRTILDVPVIDRARSRLLWTNVCDAMILILDGVSARSSLLETLLRLQLKKGTVKDYKTIILLAILLDIKSANAGPLSSQGRDSINQQKESLLYVLEEDGSYSRVYDIPDSKKGCAEIYDAHRDIVLKRFEFCLNIAVPATIDDVSLPVYLNSCKERMESALESTKKVEAKKNGRGKRKQDPQFSTQEYQYFLHFGKTPNDLFEFGAAVDDDLISKRRTEFLDSINESPTETEEIYLFVVKFHNWEKNIIFQKVLKIRLSVPQSRFYLLLSSMRRIYGESQLVVNPVQKFGEKALKSFVDTVLDLTCLSNLSKRMKKEEKGLRAKRVKALLADGVNADEGSCRMSNISSRPSH
jgi:hypothetical protein